MKPLDASKVRRRLEEKLRALHVHAGACAQLLVERSADRTDEAQAENTESERIDQWELRASLARQIRAALARLDRGQYGMCGECGAQIGTLRLDAVPWAERCVDCQTAFETQNSAGQHPPLDAATPTLDEEQAPGRPF